MKTLEQIAKHELQKKLKKRLEELNAYEDLIWGAIFCLETEEQWQELLNFLDTGVTDLNEIEDKISEIDEKYNPEDYEEDDISGVEKISQEDKI